MLSKYSAAHRLRFRILKNACPSLARTPRLEQRSLVAKCPGLHQLVAEVVGKGAESELVAEVVGQGAESELGAESEGSCGQVAIALLCWEWGARQRSGVPFLPVGLDAFPVEPHPFLDPPTPDPPTPSSHDLDLDPPTPDPPTPSSHVLDLDPPTPDPPTPSFLVVQAPWSNLPWSRLCAAKAPSTRSPSQP
jgi:hypothetical protein